MTPQVLIAQDVANALDESGVGSDRFKGDFTDFISGSRIPSYFGRQGDFNRPPSAVTAELQKIHIRVKGSWSDNLRLYDRTSDSMVVYTRHFFHPHVFLILAFLHPDAHEMSQNYIRIGTLADMADRLRVQNLDQLVPQRRSGS